MRALLNPYAATLYLSLLRLVLFPVPPNSPTQLVEVNTVHSPFVHRSPICQNPPFIFSLNFSTIIPKMPITKGPDTPPPMIGKIGRYTVFITPPTTPKPSEQTVVGTPDKVTPPPPMVQAPPLQFDKSATPTTASSDGSNIFGFFWNAMAKVQNAHSSLDEHLARWFGLNQSKYQWALDDYYETKGVEKENAKAKEVSNKVQSV